MTVAHSSVFRLEDFSLDSYYNQENLKTAGLRFNVMLTNIR